MGYCALDRRRRPLTGAELRGCWTERTPAGSPATSHAGDSQASAVPNAAPEPGHRLRLPPREFVPVELLVAERTPAMPAGLGPSEPATPFLPVDAPDTWAGRTSLFGDAER